VLTFVAMAKIADKIRFKAKLLRPASPKGAAWTFLVLPANASAKLPTRSMASVEGTLDGQSFQATLEPDGQGSHWLKVDKALREAAAVVAGDTVALEIAPVEVEPEPRVPADLRKALAANPDATATWSDITPWHAATGSTGSHRARKRKRAPSASTPPATSWRPACAAPAASTVRACTTRASAHLKQRSRPER